MSRVIIIKNKDTVDRVWCGKEITVSGIHQIESISERNTWAADETFLHALTDGTAVVNNGDNDLSVTKALDWIKDISTTPSLGDGKPLFAPNRFSQGIMTNRTGVGDDVENGIRFGGEFINFDITTSGEHYLTVQFIEPTEVAGGSFYAWEGSEMYDHLSFEVNVDATPSVLTSGIGNMSKFPIFEGAPVNIYVPTVSGDWTIDLSETLNENVKFTKATPVPNPYKTGFFDYNGLTNTLTVNTNQKGQFDLYDFPMRLGQFMTKIFIAPKETMNCVDPAVKPFACLPHWKLKATLFNHKDKNFRLSCKLYVGRYDIS